MASFIQPSLHVTLTCCSLCDISPRSGWELPQMLGGPGTARWSPDLDRTGTGTVASPVSGWPGCSVHTHLGPVWEYLRVRLALRSEIRLGYFSFGKGGGGGGGGDFFLFLLTKCNLQPKQMYDTRYKEEIQTKIYTTLTHSLLPKR